MKLEKQNPHPRDKKIEFDEKEHKYFVDGRDMDLSVTGFVQKFFDKFDANKIIEKYYDMWQCKESSKYFGMEKEEIKDMWDYEGKISRDKGTAMHLAIENFYNGEEFDQSIEEFEYHADMARWMGFGKSFQDGCKINIHISGKQGPEGIIKALPKLSPEARNLITIENDEMSHGLDQSLMLEKHLALVLDIHHHLIRDEEYIQPDDDRVKRVIDSWRGVRPSMHYSYFRDEALAMAGLTPKEMHNGLHDMKDLLARGAKKQKLRAHSDLFPNVETNQWALGFSENFDIQCEAKGKNMASEQLYEQFKSSGNAS